MCWNSSYSAISSSLFPPSDEPEAEAKTCVTIEEWIDVWGTLVSAKYFIFFKKNKYICLWENCAGWQGQEIGRPPHVAAVLPKDPLRRHKQGR